MQSRGGIYSVGACECYTTGLKFRENCGSRRAMIEIPHYIALVAISKAQRRMYTVVLDNLDRIVEKPIARSCACTYPWLAKRTSLRYEVHIASSTGLYHSSLK